MLEWLRELGSNGLFNLAAGTASILSLLVSAYVAYRVSQIRNQALLNARAEEFITVLTNHASVIANLMQNHDQMRGEILVKISTCNAALQHLKRVSSGSTKTLAVDAIRRIEIYRGRKRFFGERSGEPRRDRLEQIYRCLLELVADLRHSEADRRWRV